MKMQKTLLAVAAPLVVGACAAAVEPGADTDAAVPEDVVTLAAPDQNVRSARLRPEDGCYWYLHDGPVETTLVPLRTVDGRRICRTTVPPTGS